jgi:hypothetical protein
VWDHVHTALSPQGDELSPRGSWGICVPVLPEGLTVDGVFFIPFDLHGVVSCFPTFKTSQEEFETCNMYELTYETTEYDPSTRRMV